MIAGNEIHWAGTLLIVDDFIKDKALLAEINNDPYWDSDVLPSRWYERYTDPVGPLQQYVDQVYHLNYPNIITDDVRGFEYWGWNVKSSQGGIGIHIDHDEHAQWVDGTVQTPRYITVFYPEVSEDIEGGELLIYNEKHHNETQIFINGVHPSDASPEQLADLGKPLVLTPKSNRLIIAPGCFYHEVLEVTRGTRKTLACNAWKTPSDDRDSITFDYANKDEIVAKRY